MTNPGQTNNLKDSEAMCLIFISSIDYKTDCIISHLAHYKFNTPLCTYIKNYFKEHISCSERLCGRKNGTSTAYCSSKNMLTPN